MNINEMIRKWRLVLTEKDGKKGLRVLRKISPTELTMLRASEKRKMKSSLSWNTSEPKEKQSKPKRKRIGKRRKKQSELERKPSRRYGLMANISKLIKYPAWRQNCLKKQEPQSTLKIGELD